MTTTKKSEFLSVEEFLTDKFECRDIFLYPGYKCGEVCPECKKFPEDTVLEPCHCYDERLKKFRSGQ